MKNYLIIDARHFDIRCVLIGHQEDRIVILENRQYLSACDQKIWEKKFPEIVEKIQNDYPELRKVVLLPESVCLNLTVEISERDNFTIEQRIAHVLYKNFQIYPSKFGFRFFHLDKNRYAVIVIEKRFLSFIRRHLLLNRSEDWMFFPPFVGLLSYVKRMDEEKTSLAVFYEHGLRRFFIKNNSEINFIDFYQTTNTLEKVSFKDIKSTHQLILQSLNIEDKNKSLFLFGEVPVGLSELMRQEYGSDVNHITNLNCISGLLENISLVSQCIYVGIDDTITTENSSLKAFDFASIILGNSFFKNLRRFLGKHKVFVSFFLWFWFVVSLSFLGYKSYETNRVRKKLAAYKILKRDVNVAKKCNKDWKNQNECRTFLPAFFLKCYDILQNIACDFCIDGIGINTEKNKSFCCIRGRVPQKDSLSFENEAENNFKKELKIKKLDLKTEKLDEQKLHYQIKIPVKIPEELL